MITFDHVFKKFQRKETTLIAVKDISFHIPQGEIVGVTGANGSGKTTTFKMLAGVLAPTKGYVRTMGYDPMKYREIIGKEVGVLFGKHSRLFNNMTIQSSYELTKKIYQLSEVEYRKRLCMLEDILKLTPILQHVPNSLSLGERLRADIGMLLLPNPRLLILDEIMLGIDTLIREDVHNYLCYLNKEFGTTILIASHDVSDITRLCNRILVLKEGSLNYYGSIRYLIDKFASHKTMTIELQDKIPDMQDLPIYTYSIDGKKLIIKFDSIRVSSGIVINHILEQCEIRNVIIQEAGLEEALQCIYSN